MFCQEISPVPLTSSDPVNYNKAVHKFITYDPKGGENMTAGLTRLTFVVTEDMKPRLIQAKKNLFYDRSQSDMIRELVMAGLNVIDEKAAMERRNAQVF